LCEIWGSRHSATTRCIVTSDTSNQATWNRYHAKMIDLNIRPTGTMAGRSLVHVHTTVSDPPGKTIECKVVRGRRYSRAIECLDGNTFGFSMLYSHLGYVQPSGRKISRRPDQHQTRSGGIRDEKVYASTCGTWRSNTGIRQDRPVRTSIVTENREVIFVVKPEMNYGIRTSQNALKVNYTLSPPFYRCFGIDFLQIDYT
jgi:hypothetical protein